MFIPGAIIADSEAAAAMEQDGMVVFHGDAK